MVSEMTEEVKNYARDLGADLVGVCSIKSLEIYDTSILPDAKVAVVFLYRHSEGALSSDNLRMAQYETYCVYQGLGFIGNKLVRFLEDKGFKSVSIPLALPLDMGGEKMGLKGDFSLRHAAVEAGLGEMGLNRLLITKRFGPRVRIGAILTNASLKPDKRSNEKICDNCGECVKACPVEAITMEGNVDVFKCSIELLKYGPPGLTAFLSDLVEKTGGEISQLISDPVFLNIWQTLTLGTFYYCFECIKACPIGWAKK